MRYLQAFEDTDERASGAGIDVSKPEVRGFIAYLLLRGSERDPELERASEVYVSGGIEALRRYSPADSGRVEPTSERLRSLPDTNLPDMIDKLDGAVPSSLFRNVRQVRLETGGRLESLAPPDDGECLIE